MIIAATGAVALFYVASIVMSLFGMTMPYLHSPSPLGIGISLVIVGIAAFSPESSDAWTETVVLAPGSMTLDVAEVALARLELWMTAQVDKPAQIEDGR